MIRCITCNVLHMLLFSRFLHCLAWFDTVEFNRLPCPKNEMYDDAVFANRFHCQLPIFVIRVLIMALSIFSCFYCICNRYWQNHRRILPNLLLFVWFYTLECNRLPCSNNKICDDTDFADRFRYQLAMFANRVLIWLSWLLHAHIAYIWEVPKLSQHSAEFAIVCIMWYDWIQSSAMFKQQDVLWYGFQLSILTSIDYV